MGTYLSAEMHTENSTAVADWAYGLFVYNNNIWYHVTVQKIS